MRKEKASVSFRFFLFPISGFFLLRFNLFAQTPEASPEAVSSVQPGMALPSSESAGGAINDALNSIQLTTGISLSRRTGDLVWSIAGDLSEQPTPNILSELSYFDLEINELLFDMQIHFKEGWLRSFVLESRLQRGNIFDGHTIDSDYDANDRNDEFSRSISANTGDHVADYSFAIGYQQNVWRWVEFKAWLGYAKHEQFLRKQKAEQIVVTPGKTPSQGPIEGLNSTYQSTWEGPWVGIDIEARLGPVSGFWRGEHHNVDFYAEADWNLREGFNHPRSFEQRSEGAGNIAEIGLSFYFRLRHESEFAVDMLVRTEWWEASQGVDTVYLSGGSEVSTWLNGVDWESDSVRIGVRYIK